MTREPGGTKLGEKLRDVLLDRKLKGQISPRSELLLYEAARSEHVLQVLIPKKEQGFFILCDRYKDSSTAFQAYGRGLKIEDVEYLNNWATYNFNPDMVVFLNADLKEQQSSFSKRDSLDRIELEAHDFHERVQMGFLKMSQDKSWFELKAFSKPEEMAQKVWSKWKELGWI